MDLFEFANDWKPFRDVWAIKISIPLLGGATMFSSIYINNYFRKAVKLNRQGYATSLLPIAVIPTMIGALLHVKYVLEPISDEGIQTCSVCLQLKSGFYHTLVSVVQPASMAPISAFVNADRYYTYVIPSIFKEPLAVLKLTQKLLRKFSANYSILLFLNFVGAFTIAHFEQLNYATLLEKTLKTEELIGERKVEIAKNQLDMGEKFPMKTWK